MSDNKVRLSRDVLDKAESIAAEWGLKNARAAIEAVFRCYCDSYRQGPPPFGGIMAPEFPPPTLETRQSPMPVAGQCDALEALDDLLAL